MLRKIKTFGFTGKDLLDDRVLYFDTDSCIFISKEGFWEPELGDYLGDLTNEIEGSHGNYIVEFSIILS